MLTSPSNKHPNKDNSLSPSTEALTLIVHTAMLIMKTTRSWWSLVLCLTTEGMVRICKLLIILRINLSFHCRMLLLVGNLFLRVIHHQLLMLARKMTSPLLFLLEIPNISESQRNPLLKGLLESEGHQLIDLFFGNLGLLPPHELAVLIPLIFCPLAQLRNSHRNATVAMGFLEFHQGLEPIVPGDSLRTKTPLETNFIKFIDAISS
mmetsp:Transcript_36362/g.87742  ORF Transcript_36362/g.87742 Transcript_36362/m.87742 type:complete len:207 (-) Transcript_36362:590-1210(-)